MSRRPAGLKLVKAIHGFLQHKAAEALSPRTLEGYEHDLNTWLSQVGDVDIGSVTTQDLRSYLAWLRTDYKPRRRIAIYAPPANSGYMVLRQRNVPDRSVEVRQGMVIHDRDDREVGKVAGILATVQKRRGRYIVFRRGRALPLQLIHVDLVENVTSEGVRLRIDREYMKRLPIYSPRLAKKWAS